MKQEQTIVTKVDINLYTLFLHMQDYQEIAKLTGDNVLYLFYDALMKYLEKQILLQSGDIEDTYVVVEQRIEK